MKLLVWTKGLTRPDEIVEGVERVTFLGKGEHIWFKLWDESERKIEDIERVMIID